MKLDLDALAGMLVEDVAAYLDDPDAAKHTVRVNLADGVTYMTGEKQVDVRGRVKTVADPKEIWEALGKLATLARGYFGGFVEETRRGDPGDANES